MFHLLLLAAIVSVPAGWRDQPPPSPITIGSWMNDSGESIVVERSSNFGFTLADFAKRERRFLEAKHLTFVGEKPVVLCGGAEGLQQTYSDANGNAYTVVYQLTYRRAYVLTYSYLASTNASTAGAAAAQSLCAPPDPIVNLGPPPFAPPSHWIAQPQETAKVSGGTMKFWPYWPVSEKAASETVYVMTAPMPQGGGLSYGVAELIAREFRGPAAVTKRTPINLCGKYDGVAIEVRGLRGGEKAIVESVMTVSGKTAYVASYSRNAAEPKDPAAEAAIRSLCPR